MAKAPLRKWLPLRFPWRDGNQFTLLLDGVEFFPRMLDAIAQARHSICMELYLAASGEIFTLFSAALIAAAARGVKVRLLLDDFGSLQLSTQDRDRLFQGGVMLQFYNRLRWRKGLRNLFRDHRKLLLVDDTVAFTGGAGLTDEFWKGKNNQPPWRETIIEARGPVLADWLFLYERTWRGLSFVLRASDPGAHPPRPQAGQRGCVVASNGPQAHHVMQSLQSRLKHVQRRAWLVTPYFVPSWSLRRRLVKTARRKVDVRVLVPGPMTDHPAIRHASRRFYAGLLRQGVRIFEYQPRFIHAKMALCDQWVTVGSTNFDRWNFHWNLDANQEVDDPAFAAQALAAMEADFAQSLELHYDQWQRRGWWWRLLETLTGKLDRWLSRLTINTK
jgi:phosphatidylserine/phosphatidylglycerophosphate/cardiolipin synthase-like enzyme